MAAAYGWAARLAAGREVGTAWAALATLAGDERAPVRVGTLEALASFAARPARGERAGRAATDGSSSTIASSGSARPAWWSRSSRDDRSWPPCPIPSRCSSTSSARSRRSSRRRAPPSARTRAGACCWRCHRRSARWRPPSPPASAARAWLEEACRDAAPPRPARGAVERRRRARRQGVGPGAAARGALARGAGRERQAAARSDAQTPGRGAGQSSRQVDDALSVRRRKCPTELPHELAPSLLTCRA